MLRGSLEVIEFIPRQVTVDPPPVIPSRESEGICGRFRLEHRTLTTFLAALASLALHAFLVAPALWMRGVPSPHSPAREYARGTSLQWIVLDDSPKAAAAIPDSADSPALVAIRLSGIVPTLPAVSAAPDGSEHRDPEDHSSLGEMSGRYVGQIQARIDRAWLRPRTAIGAPIFRCQVQVDQDGAGRVDDVTLLQCNGDTRWRLSLVHAIEAASPLPAPPAFAVFTRHVLLEFRAMAYSSGAEAGLYESPEPAAARAMRKENEKSQSTFQALREAVTAPHSHGVIELRIEGSKSEVVPEH